jgi:hypothetical protein
MSDFPNLMNKTLPTVEAPSIAAGLPFSARKALLFWVILMVAAWLLVGIGAYAFMSPGI